MQADFEQAWNRLKDVHVNAEGEQYTKETTETAQEYMDLIEKLLTLDGVEVELCGSWIWLTGNTRLYKDQIKALGFRWSQKKGAWYFHREPYRKHSKKELTLDEIRAMYGSERFTGPGRSREALPA